ncbi:MAG: efflux RND transporter periplasmic adaptor subunit [Balneolales bacterium]
MDWKKTLIVCLVILFVAAAVTWLIFSTEPTATESDATKETAMLVEVIKVDRNTFTPTIQTMGTVEPSQDITLSPRVGGEVINISENFTPGGYVKKGEVLLEIDPSDYKHILQQRRSELQQAEADLEIEMGRQNVAQQDYELLDDELTGGGSRSLILREPQLNAVRSTVASAEAAVQQAELDLQRTTIRSPFNAYILSRNVNAGSQVTPDDNLARLVGFDEYWVEATVPQSSLRWITLPVDGEEGSPVTIRNRTAWQENEYRQGTLFRLVGALENDTRMARVLVSVPDPHGYKTGNTDQPRLMIGSFVETNIQAEKLENVIRLNRDYIRQNDTVWVMDNDSLDIRDVTIIFRDATFAYITGGLDENELVVTTNISTVIEGAPLRLDGSETAVAQDSLENGNL